MNPDLYWIPGPWRGRLAIVARPRGSDWLADEVSGWRRAGIDVVVSLLEAEESAQLELQDERRLVEAGGISFLSFPIPDCGVPASTPAAIALISDITAALEQGNDVAIHCRQGVGRSGLIAAAVLGACGVGAEQAIEIVGRARGVAVPETADQRRWLFRLPAKPSVTVR